MVIYASTIISRKAFCESYTCVWFSWFDTVDVTATGDTGTLGTVTNCHPADWEHWMQSSWSFKVTVKILKIGTPEIITIIVLQLEQLDFTVQYCVQKMQTE